MPKIGDLARILQRSLVEWETTYLSDSLSPEAYQFMEKRIKFLKAISSQSIQDNLDI